MAFDTFLKIDGIEGESTDDKHKGWIEILSYSWGESQMVSRTASSSGGGTSARVDMQDLSVVKTLDKSSPLICLACAEGKHIKEVTLQGRWRQDALHGIQDEQCHRQLGQCRRWWRR